MFRFAHPNYFLLLIPVLLTVLLYVWTQIKRRKNLKLWGELETLKHLMPNVSFVRPHLKYWMQFLALLLLVVVLAQPQFGQKEETVKKSGIELMIALDVSNSMLAQDVQPNRLLKSKQVLSQMIDQMSDDKVGLVIFAGDAYVQMPMTADYDAAKLFLSTITTNSVPLQGTSIGSAIDLCIKSFSSDNNSVGKAIVIITDAENHEDDVISAAKLARKNNIQVHVVGMGTPEGAPIPIGSSLSFKKDNQGNVVVTKLNEQLGASIAEAGGGIYVRADNTDAALRHVTKQLSELSKGTFDEKQYSNFNEQFQSFALIALILLMIEYFIFNRQNKWFSRIKIFDVKK